MQSHPPPTQDRVLDQLKAILYQLGQPTGQISPAIYDSAYAVILGYYELPESLAVCAWLAERQQGDGGWGDPDLPYARTIPSMAALIALHVCRDHVVAERIERGMAFLCGHLVIWDAPLHDGIPCAVELIVPHLVELAAQHGLRLPPPPARLVQLGQMRRKRLASAKLQAGAAALFSWETWGCTPEASHLDELGSVCSSPAATLAWVKFAADLPHLQNEVVRARGYLRQVALATGSSDRPLLPNIWPIDHYELAFVLWTLEVAGLLRHPALEPLAAALVARLRTCMRPTGISSNSSMVADSDNTAVALAVLAVWDGCPVDLAPLEIYRQSDHYASYLGEIQPSVSCTAHAIHALQLNQAPCDPRLFDFLLTYQSHDGLWWIDKWHVRWSYITSQVLMVLDPVKHAVPLQHAMEALDREQHPCGGWGVYGSNREETAYIVLALRYLERMYPAGLDERVHQMLDRAEHWLSGDLDLQAISAPCWMAKEVYHPTRLAALIELAAVFLSLQTGRPIFLEDSV